MKTKTLIRTLVIMTIIMVASSFYYLPYYVTKPGSAHELDPIVHVENGYQDDGELMLTTVRMGRANIYAYLMASIRKYEYIFPVDEIRSPHESDEEYNLRQLQLMNNSQSHAIEVAYKKAGKPYKYNYKGIYVLNIYPSMPAEDVLKPGDRITAIDGQTFQSSQEFIDYVSGKAKGDKVEITYVRNKNKKVETIPLEAFPDIPDKVGLGITLSDDKEIVTDPPVKLETEEIGGPSAGLMFSLEIYDQLTEDDLPKGHRIAGTGTISEDGKVGRIGGIEQKIIAADKAGAEYFLAPDETITKEMKEKYPDLESNYVAAIRTAEDIGTDMKVVPVRSFEEALAFLQTIDK
ncbi:SepM family pheromone-processing serine protease [Rossellomorea sp. YZS02]|uniref:SepM family pheromone-processing serine protease n=1 Tax=Rossellomorea sp. YZS02 TaxID=3097358 RepID=UPI002A178A5F|nr:SepM family pheromone-processing serine protease [Rossellomorea sp. YZS02]MDX8342985.1 SepM family pheromone-processing serine protease [Rossellomorea sp. YZS02]